MKVAVFDLDDTLYKEIDFLKSAFKEIADMIHRDYGYLGVLERMMIAYSQNKNVFEYLNNYYSLSIPISKYLSIYRNNIPDISLDVSVINTLSELKSSNIVMGLITDGRTITQKNKIKALKLKEFFEEDCIVISEDFGSEKPDLNNFLYFSNKFPAAEFFYIGDNLNKDFIAPKKLNWVTICLLDDGNNIHKQIFDINSKYNPDYRINDISEIIKIIK